LGFLEKNANNFHILESQVWLKEPWKEMQKYFHILQSWVSLKKPWKNPKAIPCDTRRGTG